jgi:adenylyltransferase/sulfurtransferase
LTFFSALDFEFRQFKLRRDPNCPVCGDHPTITAPIDYEQFCGMPILDPKSIEETREEVEKAKGHAKPQAAGLDEKGLPKGYPFKPDWETTPREVKSKLDQHDPKFMLIDVREPNEFDITHIVENKNLYPRARWMQIPQALKGHENDEIVVHCKSGARSLQVTQMLRQQGFKNVKNMAGGILLWNKDINPGGPQY